MHAYTRSNEVHDIPAPPTQSTTSAKALVTRAQQVEGSSGSSSSLGICRRNTRRHRSMSSATSGRTSASPLLGPSRSLAEPYPSLNSTHAGQALATSATNQDSPSRSTLSTSTSTSSTAGSSRLEILLNLVQANSASRVERRAQRQRSMEVAQKANEQMRRQAFEKGLLQRREDHVRRPYHDEDDRRTGFEHAARGSSEEPRSRSPTNIDARKTTLQPTRSLPIISELPPIVTKPPLHQPSPAIRSPENRSSQQSWAGGVKPCGLRGGGIPRGRSVGAVSSGGDGVGQRAGKDSAESSPAAPRLCRPFKAPTMMNRRPIVQDQNSMEVEPDRKRSNACSARGVAPAVITKSAAEARFPQRPPPQPLADRSRHLNSNNTSTSTSTSTLASTTCEATDTGNDSFDDDTADMEGLLMEGGEEVEALLRACDGA
jgi:hypothetical protein